MIPDFLSQLKIHSGYPVADAPHTIVDDKVLVYTPDHCIERALRTFFSGLTDQERAKAGKSLMIEAREADGFHDLAS